MSCTVKLRSYWQRVPSGKVSQLWRPGAGVWIVTEVCKIRLPFGEQLTYVRVRNKLTTEVERVEVNIFQQLFRPSKAREL